MTQDDIIEMVRKAGYMPINDYYTNGTVKAFSESQIERFANFVEVKAAAKEREACAKICDVMAVHPEYASDVTKLAALAIRARN